MKSYGGLWDGKINKWVTFGGNLGLLGWVNEQKHLSSRSMSWSRCSNDLETLGLAFRQAPTFFNTYCQAASNFVDPDWGLGQGGLDLCFSSASSKL